MKIRRVLVLVLWLGIVGSFHEPHPAIPWSAIETGSPNTHQALCRKAYEALELDPALRFDPVYPAPVFPPLDDILSRVGEPDDDKAVFYSAHVYNPEVNPMGYGPESVKKSHTELSTRMSMSYGVPFESAKAAKYAAWLAHFAQDLTSPYHVLGIMGGLVGNTKIDDSVWGPRKPSVSMEDLVKRYRMDKERNPNADWFDPWYYNGTGANLDTNIAGSDHVFYEGFPIPSDTRAPSRRHQSWGLYREIEAEAAVLAENIRRKVDADQTAFSPTSKTTGDFLFAGGQFTYILWRASFSALRPGNIEAIRIPGKVPQQGKDKQPDIYRVKVRVKNFEDKESAKGVKVTYVVANAKNINLVKHGTRTVGPFIFFSPPIPAPYEVPPGDEMDLPAVDIPVSDPDFFLLVYVSSKYDTTPDSGIAQRAYPLEDLLRKASAAGAAPIGLTKRADTASAIAGDEVTYTYQVTNTGNLPLSDVKVADDNCSPVERTDAADGGDLLGPGKTREFRCTMTIREKTTNTAVASALDPDGKKVSSLPARCTVTIGDAGKVRLPNVLRMTREAAEREIVDGGLVVGRIEYRADDSVSEGEVIGQSPDPDQVPVVDAGSAVDLVLSIGKERRPLRILVTPPFPKVPVGQAVSLEADVIFSDGIERRMTGTVAWDPGPGNRFTCNGPGKFIVRAEYQGASGAATVTCEEDWSVPSYEPPITSSRDRGAKLPQPVPGDYKWYAYCDPRSGEVTYGEHLLTGRRILSGPFAGPRTAYDWIRKNCSGWRCDANGVCTAAPARGGEWKVLCDRNDRRIYLGKTLDSSRFLLVQEGFLGEPDARAWATGNYPGWECTENGAPVARPQTGARWSVVCSKRHGGVALTQHPDPIDYHIWNDNFFREPDARRWTDQNCPSWRCDATGRCLAGAGRPSPSGRPLEVPPEGPSSESERERVQRESLDWWTRPAEGAGKGAAEGVPAGQPGKTPGAAARKETKPPAPSPPRPPAGKPPVKEAGSSVKSAEKKASGGCAVPADCAARKKKLHAMIGKYAAPRKKGGDQWNADIVMRAGYSVGAEKMPARALDLNAMETLINDYHACYTKYWAFFDGEQEQLRKAISAAEKRGTSNDPAERNRAWEEIQRIKAQIGKRAAEVTRAHNKCIVDADKAFQTKVKSAREMCK